MSVITSSPGIDSMFYVSGLFFQVIVSPRPDITVSVFGNGTDVLVGRIVAPPNKAGVKKADRTLFLIYLVDAGTVAAYQIMPGLTSHRDMNVWLWFFCSLS